MEERIFRKQPSVEEIKQDTVFLRYVVNDEMPQKGLKRMTYYTELASRPGEIYFLQSYRQPTPDEALKRMQEERQIVQVPGDVTVPWEQDVWLNQEGKVLLAKGYAPWKGKKKLLFNITE